jgi:hypothetical protein
MIIVPGVDHLRAQPTNFSAAPVGQVHPAGIQFRRAHSSKSILVPKLVLTAFGLLGMRDDLAGIRGSNGQGNGFKARFKASLHAPQPSPPFVLYFLDPERRYSGHRRQIDLSLFYIRLQFVIVAYQRCERRRAGRAGRLNGGVPSGPSA